MNKISINTTIMDPQEVTCLCKPISFYVQMKVNFHFHNKEAINTPSSTIKYPLQMCWMQTLVFLNKISAHQSSNHVVGSIYLLSLSPSGFSPTSPTHGSVPLGYTSMCRQFQGFKINFADVGEEALVNISEDIGCHARSEGVYFSCCQTCEKRFVLLSNM